MEMQYSGYHEFIVNVDLHKFLWDQRMMISVQLQS